jgi:hypothetical protein
MKMKTQLIISILFIFSLTACTKNFEETNTNPDRPVSVQPQYLFNGAVYSIMNLYGGEMRKRVFSHYSNYVAVGGGQLERYFWIDGTLNGYFQNTYTNCLQPLYQIQKLYGSDPGYRNRVAIAKIMESYVYSNAASIWGPMPKKAALSGEQVIAYDSEQDIFNAVLDTLKAAANAINLTGDKYTTGDAIYNGDLLKWKKFANTLRLRIAIQIVSANSTKAEETLSDVLSNEENTINSPAETAFSKWGNTSLNWSYLYDYNIVNATSNSSSINVASEALVKYMLPYNDPRLPIYAKPAPAGTPNAGQYWGMPLTNQLPRGVSMNPTPHPTNDPKNYSPLGDVFTKMDADHVFLSYEETQFLKAEAAFKGWGGTKTAEQYYTTGITASMQKYGIAQAQINTYLNTPGIKWNTVVDTTGRSAEFEDYLGITTSAILTPNPFRQIIMQEWLAGFYRAIDAWTLIRRTQVLEFVPHFNPDGSEGGTVGFAYIPQRMVYPQVEYQINTDEVKKAVALLNGTDIMRTKLWWALPTKTNPFLPPWQ